MLVLCVAEKPSVAVSIATALSRNAHTTRRGAAGDVHEFHGRFRGSDAAFRVTCVRGHVYNVDFAEQYQSWDLNAACLFEAETVKTPSSQGVIAHLTAEACGCLHLVLWLDCDREGENICFEVMHIVLPHLQRSSSQQVWRLTWFVCCSVQSSGVGAPLVPCV